MKNNRQWAHNELDRQIDELAAKGEWNEEARLHVSSPEYREHIVRLITKEIWPGMQRILEPTELTYDLCSDDGLPNIEEDLLAVDMSMSFVMLIASDKASFKDDPYFCRTRVRCSVRGFMINNDFYIHFPEDFDFNRLKSIMGHEKFAGNPPKLNYEIGSEMGPGIMVLGFEHGQGNLYGGALPVDTMLADFAERMNFLRRLIRAVDFLSEDFTDNTRFDRMTKELVKCFEAW